MVKALKIINDSGYLCVLVTNQPAVARDITEKLQSDLKNSATFLGRKKFILTEFITVLITQKKVLKMKINFIKKCSCRKPNNGMFKSYKNLNIDIKNSYMMGDRLTDYMAAKKQNKIYWS